MSAIQQHKDARELLSIIELAVETHKPPLTYKDVAKLLGRTPPEHHSRAVGQVCDLLDAAAALAGVPLLAFVKVLNQSGKINPKAWKEDAARRDAIIRRSLDHEFSKADFQAIYEALTNLDGKGNIAAWKCVRATFPIEVLYRRLTEPNQAENLNAIDDIGTDEPDRAKASGWTYDRDPEIRAAVMRRAEGKCEFCGELGFSRSGGGRYLECHHIIALAKDGADRMTNVIALCPNHHREAHFGERQAALEKEMIQKVIILEGQKKRLGEGAVFSVTALTLPL